MKNMNLQFRKLGYKVTLCKQHFFKHSHHVYLESMTKNHSLTKDAFKLTLVNEI